VDKLQLMRNMALLSLTLLLVVVQSFMWVVPVTASTDLHTLVDVFPNGPDSLDPAFGYTVEDSIVEHAVYEYLLAYKTLTEFEPRIATKVPSVENGLISEDGLTYTFPIRKGVKFQNGDEVTPEDVEYSFERAIVADPAGGPVGMILIPLLGDSSTRDIDGQLNVTYEEISNTVEVDGDNVVFHLAHAAPQFLQILTHGAFPIIDKKWTIEQGGWPGTKETWKEYNNLPREKMTLFDKAMGAGPYRLVRWDKGTEIVLEFFDGYYRGPSKGITTVILKYVPEWSTRSLMLKTGDADIAVVPREFLEQVQESGDVTVEGFSVQEIFAVIFNQHVLPGSRKYIGSGTLDGNGVPEDFFANLEVRQAFNYAFDFTTYIRDVFQGDALQPNGPFPDSMPYRNADQVTYYFDPQKATQLLKSVYNGQLWDLGFKMRVPYPTDFPPCKGMVDILKYDLKQINPKFDVETIPMTWSEFYGDLSHGLVPFTSVIWLNDFPDPSNSCECWMSRSGYYGSAMSLGGEYDDLCVRGASVLDPTLRKQIYYEVQRRAYDDAVAIWGAQPELFHVSGSWVKGWTPYPPTFVVYANYYYNLWKEASDS